MYNIYKSQKPSPNLLPSNLKTSQHWFHSTKPIRYSITKTTAPAWVIRLDEWLPDSKYQPNWIISHQMD